jgi:hypothetical protein
MDSSISPPSIPSRNAPLNSSTPPYYYSQPIANAGATQTSYSMFPQHHFPFASNYFPFNSSFALPNTQAITGPLRSILIASQQLVQAFSGIAQVLDSAYIATFASFSATMTIVEQLRQLKRYLFSRRKSTEFSGKPFALFVITCALIPWLLNKLYAHLQANSSLGSTEPEEQLKGNKQFAVALFSFDGQQPGDLPVKRDEIVAVLSSEPNGWSQCRTEDGRIGAVPTNHLKMIGK